MQILEILVNICQIIGVQFDISKDNPENFHFYKSMICMLQRYKNGTEGSIQLCK